MALHDEKHKWGAQRVRDTFLEYFKERGHTFGECNSPHSRYDFPRSSSN
jgi:alanyl-tRNA synthetase